MYMMLNLYISTFNRMQSMLPCFKEVSVIHPGTINANIWHMPTSVITKNLLSPY